jgi:hypothetical protein
MGEAMLVQIRKSVELPEGSSRVLLLPSEVRLQLLDDCLRVWMDAPDHLPAFTRLEGFRSEDGEGQRFGTIFGQGINPGVSGGEFVDEIVEGGMEVVEAITNDEAKSGGRVLEDFEINTLLSALRVEFGDVTVRVFFDPSANIGVEALQVLPRPL